MVRIASLSGTGTVSVDGGYLCDANYSIEVWKESSGLKSARGSIDGLYSKLSIAMHGEPELTLQDGRVIRFLIERLQIGTHGGGCQIVVNGPIPGV